MQQHRQYQQQDEFFCRRCGKRWGVREQAPPCVKLGTGEAMVKRAPHVPGSKYL